MLNQNERSFHSKTIPGAVLIIEDQKTFSSVLVTVLNTKLTCATVVCATLAEAREVLARSHAVISIAICDLTLPDGSNEEVIDAVQAHGIPVIALTGTFSDSLRNLLLRRGVVDYVLKRSLNSLEYVASLVERVTRNRQIKALVVDDSESSLTIIRHYLARQKITAICTKSPVDALAILEQEKDIQLVLSDHEMPHMSGVEFVTQIRKKHRKEKLAIIGISGSEDKTLVAHFLKSGANDFIPKPFSYEEFLCRVTQNLQMLDLIKETLYVSNTDYLTGLYNRRYFFESGQVLLQEAAVANQSSYLAVIDIDYFKRINDQFGHDVGDLAISFLARTMQTFFASELVARIGGEEFVILFHRQEKNEILDVLEQFRAHIEQTPFQLPGAASANHDGRLAITVSIGCASGNGDLHALMKVADLRLYQAKKAGRNRLVAG
ncbi:diguanylate cyclase [Undibacterium rugosum]|uniref:diguanylate cyclase n=1 Tax=Undibacterium rugosum TaxID=2762291 RepID=UPI001B82DFCD|nr:diguanylate cyclase [Undibacterium rugosum]MBR7776888.1 diguanylate cyclase [Undibacterium rugosum]